MSNDPRFPVGRFSKPAAYTPELRSQFLAELEELPSALRSAVAVLSDEQLDEPYREGGWTVRQVVHHLADSHMNSYLRSKFALSQDNYTVQPYPESIWAEYEDAAKAPVEMSLAILEGMHARWVRWLRGLPEEAFSKPFYHPENGQMDLNMVTALYSWHGRHHVAHITELRKQKGW
jgi:hypothetical protein